MFAIGFSAWHLFSVLVVYYAFVKKKDKKKETLLLYSRKNIFVFRLSIKNTLKLMNVPT